jgi:hypothetical protein
MSAGSAESRHLQAANLNVDRTLVLERIGHKDGVVTFRTG